MSKAPSTAPNRTPLWYVKFFFAAYAAGIGSFLVVFVLAVFIRGVESAGQWLIRPVLGLRLFGLPIFLLGAAWAPLIWRRLR
jgi:hypothetical protein